MQRGSPHHSTWPRHTLKDATWQTRRSHFFFHGFSSGRIQSCHIKHMHNAEAQQGASTLLCRPSECFPRSTQRERCEATRGHRRAVVTISGWLAQSSKLRRHHTSRVSHMKAKVPLYLSWLDASFITGWRGQCKDILVDGWWLTSIPKLDSSHHGPLQVRLPK